MRAADIMEEIGKMENTFQKVYHIVGQIPYGKVCTYGQIACLLGNPRLSRIVGYALRASPASLSLPCHRVVNRHGALSVAFEVCGINEQRLLLEEEGVAFTQQGLVSLGEHMWFG